MKEALAKIRKVLSRQDIVPQFTHYLVRDGFIYAFDGRFGAATPVDHKGSFLVPGREFERLIDRLPEDSLTIEPQEDSIVIRAGRLHGRIKTLKSETCECLAPGDEWSDVPSGLLAALECIRPFISDNAIHPWALCVAFERDVMRATANVSLAEVTCPGLNGNGQLLPSWAVDYVLSRHDTLANIQITDNYAAFRWDDGSWMRTQLVGGEFPAVARILFDTFVTPKWELTEDWRQAYKTTAELTENEIEVHADKLVGRQGESVVEYAVPTTPAPEGGVAKFDPKFLTPVIENATHWQPDAYPRPAPFAGPGLRGLVAGRR